MKNGIIFDLDGTLWDSSEQIAVAWNTVFARHSEINRAISVNQIINVLGKSMDVVEKTLLPDLDGERRSQIFKECCEEEVNFLLINGGRLYQKVEETLSKLNEKYDLFIVSNCQSGYIEAFLEHYGLNKCFDDFESYGNTGLGKDENLKLLAKRNGLTNVIYVGDTQGDYDATMEAGFKFIHASYGFGSINEDVVSIDKFEELPEVIERIL